MAPLWHLYKSFWLTMAYRQLIDGAIVREDGTKISVIAAAAGVRLDSSG
jgi:hypothetical protein